MAKQFKVIITETLQKEVEILAVNEDDAFDYAEKLWHDQEIVLDSSGFVEKHISVHQSVDDDDIPTWYDYVTDEAKKEQVI